MNFYQKLVLNFNKLKNLSPNARYEQKRPYIVPVKFGFYYAFSVLFMVGIGFNFSNNLVYLIAFFLGSIGLVVMHLTNYNLQKLKITLSPSAQSPLYAGQENLLLLEAQVPEKQIIYEVAFSFHETEKKKNFSEIKPEQKIDLNLFFERRGWQYIPALSFESRFPFGLLRSWKKVKFSEKVLVYPHRKGLTQIPQKYFIVDSDNSEKPEDESSNTQKNPHKDEDFLFAGHRNFQNSDSFKRVDWKAYARIQRLLIKEFEIENLQNEIEIHYKKTNPAQGLEDRISQMALWIDLAEKSNKKYRLVLPQKKIEFSHGPQHYHECMKSLAEVEKV